MCQRGGYCACEQRKRGDSAFRTALQERKQGVKKERAESGVAELCKAVIPLGKGHAGKYAEGLPEYGKPAKGNEKSGGSQACVERVTGSAQKVRAVCHFQQAGTDSLQKTGGNRQEGKQAGKQAEKTRLLRRFRQRTKKYHITADLENCCHGIGYRRRQRVHRGNGRGRGITMGRAMGFGFPPETPEHARCKRTEECGKQEGIAPERRVKKCRANCADEEKRTGVIGYNKLAIRQPNCYNDDIWKCCRSLDIELSQSGLIMLSKTGGYKFMGLDAKNAIETGRTALGIEFGSTRIKAVLIDEEHEVLAIGNQIGRAHV